MRSTWLVAATATLATAAACTTYGDQPSSVATVADGGTAPPTALADAGSPGDADALVVGAEGGMKPYPRKPVELAEFTASKAIGVAADATHVAWLYTTAFNGVFSTCAVSDCGTVHDTSTADPTGISATSDTIYASSEGDSTAAILRFGADGVATNLLSDPKANHHPFALVPTSTNVFFVDYFDQMQNGVYSLALGGPPSVTRLAMLDTTESHAWLGLASVASQLYLFEYGGIAVVRNASDVPKDYCTGSGGCSSGVFDMTTDAKSIFWTDDSKQAVLSCPVEGCIAPATIMSTPTSANAPVFLAFDGTRLIIATRSNVDGTASLLACAPNECAHTAAPIATETQFAGKPFVTSDAIYWIAQDPAAPQGDPHFRVMRMGL